MTSGTQRRITPKLGVAIPKTEDSPLHFEMVRELEAEEYRKYKASSGRILDWLFESQPVKAVQEAYEEYEDILERYHAALVNREPLDRMRLHRNINTKVSNFLRTFRAFLDQAKKNLEDRYGKDSAQARAFEKATNKAYDSSFSYRFLYQVRNYTQHVGDAVHSIPSGARAAPDDPWKTEHYLRVELDRDRFLAWRKLRASVREEVKGLPAKIELSEHLKNVADAVFEINVVINAQQVFELQGHAHRIINLVRPLKTWDGIPVILHMKFPRSAKVGETIGPLQHNIEQIPVDLAKFIAMDPPAGS